MHGLCMHASMHHRSPSNSMIPLPKALLNNQILQSLQTAFCINTSLLLHQRLLAQDSWGISQHSGPSGHQHCHAACAAHL